MTWHFLILKLGLGYNDCNFAESSVLKANGLIDSKLAFPSSSIYLLTVDILSYYDSLFPKLLI
jgi:hypothetical protein